MIGRVVSTKSKNTATILIERIAMHRLYKKTFVRSKKYLVHDSVGVKEGDIVEILKCKPISKNKHWTIVKVVGKNLEEIVEAHQKETAEEVISEVMPQEKEESESHKESKSQSTMTPNDSLTPKKKRGGKTRDSA